MCVKLIWEIHCNYEENLSIQKYYVQLQVNRAEILIYDQYIFFDP